MTTHNLKIDAQPFADLVSGAKTGEVRNDDRGFEVGDTVHLTCIDGQTMDRTISHIQRGYGLPDGTCVLSYTRPAAPVECHPRDTNSVEYHETRNVAAKPVEGLETVVLSNHGELVTRSQAEAIIAAKRAENDETYELGKRDGYSEAVQQIDLKTGGDGEYRYCTDRDPDRHTSDPASMIQRIVGRFETLNTMESISEINEWKERAGKAEADNAALTARVKELGGVLERIAARNSTRKLPGSFAAGLARAALEANR